MKNSKKIFGLGFLLLISSCLIVSGAVFTYLWSGTITANAGYLMQYDYGSGWMNAEDLTVDITTSTIVAGETETWEHDWQVNSNLNAEYDAELTFSYDGSIQGDMEGTTLTVYIDDGTTNSTVLDIVDGVDQAMSNTYTVHGGDSGTVYVVLTADDHLEENAYDWDYSVDVSVTKP